MVYEHLIDLQVESARTLARTNEKPYLRDVKTVVLNAWPGLISMIQNVDLVPQNVVQYHCRMYCNDSDYREEFHAIMSDSELLSHLKSNAEWTGFARLMRLSMRAWSVMQNHPFAGEVRRRYRLERNTMMAE